MVPEQGIKTSTGALQEKAVSISKKVASIERAFNGIASVVNSSSIYWDGSSGEAYRRYFREIQADMVEILRRLKKHPGNMLNMAGIYERSEEQAIEKMDTINNSLIR